MIGILRAGERESRKRERERDEWIEEGRKGWRENEDNRSGTNSPLLCEGGWIYDKKEKVRRKKRKGKERRRYNFHSVHY